MKYNCINFDGNLANYIAYENNLRHLENWCIPPIHWICIEESYRKF